MDAHRLAETRSIPEKGEGPRHWVWVLIIFAALVTVGMILRHGVLARFGHREVTPIVSEEAPMQDTQSKVIAKLKDRQELDPLPPAQPSPTPAVSETPPSSGVVQTIRNGLSELKEERGQLVESLKREATPAGSAHPSGATTPKVLTEAEREAKAYAKAREKARRGMTVWTREKSEKGGGLSDVKAYASPYTVAAGEPIGCKLETGLTSEVGGVVKLRVRGNVYDTVTGTHLLIPQDAWFIGTKQGAVSFNQSRLTISLQELHWGNGQYVALTKAVVSDQTGKAGLTQHVDRQWGSVIAQVVMTSLARTGSQAVGSVGGGLEDKAIGSLTQETARTTQQKSQQFLDTSTIVEVDPAFLCTLMLESNLSLAQPYRVAR